MPVNGLLCAGIRALAKMARHLDFLLDASRHRNCAHVRFSLARRHSSPVLLGGIGGADRARPSRARRGRSVRHSARGARGFSSSTLARARHMRRRSRGRGFARGRRASVGSRARLARHPVNKCRRLRATSLPSNEVCRVGPGDSLSFFTAAFRLRASAQGMMRRPFAEIHRHFRRPGATAIPCQGNYAASKAGSG